MPNYTLYRQDIETQEEAEEDTISKLVKTMTNGHQHTFEKYGRGVRMAHAKSNGVVRGMLQVAQDLPEELAQGLFAKSDNYSVIVRLSHAPGEFVDDSKVSTTRGIAIKVFGVKGTKLSGFENITTQDWLFATGGTEFLTSNAKAFLAAFTPNAEIAPKLSDSVKGAVSRTAMGTNAVLHAVGMHSSKMDFYGHPNLHPLAESYFSQVPFRYGAYVAKLGLIPSSPGLHDLAKSNDFDPQSYDALRQAVVEFFSTNPAEFDFVVQLNTDLNVMPIEDPSVPWPEDQSPYRTVAKLVIPAQNAFDADLTYKADEAFSFSPAHSLIDHQPLGSINRARLVVYTLMSKLRRGVNKQTIDEPVGDQ